MDKQTILGIDIGTNSLGWALIEKGSILNTGVRAFEAGLAELEMDGKGKSRNVERREKRLIRRQIERRSKRLHNLARLLQSAGLLPEGEVDKPDKRHSFFEELDRKLGSPYTIRTRALKEKLSPYEIGRALYHLGQRRGFLSNRKSKPKKDEDKSKVKKAISELEENISKADAETLGEYFSRLYDLERIRGRYTSRQMYEDEFERIWQAQKSHYPDILNDDLKRSIHHAIYKQRPIKKQKHLIGKCDLEKDLRRAPWAILSAQRFRYLQTLNNLRILDKDTGNERELSPEERICLIDILETEGDLKFSEIRKLPGFKKIRFNLERGGEEKIPGNRTSEKLIKVFGEGWKNFSETEQAHVVEDLRSIVKEETLKKRGMKVWKLSEEKAKELSKIEPEEGYCSFSKKAIEKLLPLLEKGKPLQTAIKEIYPDKWERNTKPMDTLPPVRSEAFGEIRNPIVERSLTELRRVVNGITGRYGKPDVIRIELARELRQTAKQREKTWERMRQNEKARKTVAEKIVEEAGITKPKQKDIEKVRLAEECGWHCPYTGREINITALLGEYPQFDIEHIIPFDRCLDNSFWNKTLCAVEENRKKSNKTPYEAYHATKKWDEIISRVKNFKGDARDEKLKRFKFTEKDLEAFLDDFTSRQLNDTRYASKLAKQYLGLLYGGLNDDGIDPDGKRRLQAIRGGQITAGLRNAWGLNSILRDGPGKSRDDHRHHAIDAIVVALTEPSTVEALSRAVKSGKGTRLSGKAELPWEGFLQDVRNAVNKIKVSHRVSKRVRGALHEETFYSPPKKGEKEKTYVHTRKPISGLSEKDIEGEDIIGDRTVRERIKAKLEELGEKNPKKAFKSPENHPYIKTKDGHRIPIHRVKIRINLEPFRVGKDFKTRYVQSDSNHHMEIVETKDKKGNIKWEGYVVNMLEAYRRRKDKEPVIKRNHGEGKEFVFSLAGGEMIELDKKDDKRGLYIVRGINPVKQRGKVYGQVHYVRHNDARKKDDILKSSDFSSRLIEPLREMNCRKVVVTPLGEVRYAND
ncbi:MAG: type II CRISPR RNA-guided endonuclease Cas9 [Nitrospirae bacterium]|nr:type II CRISPR RNA-guided endonuclease Cas9 [Nitrospirota bacterium]